MIKKILEGLSGCIQYKPNLKSHEFFTTLDHYSNIQIHAMNFKTLSKKKLIFFYTETWRNVLRDSVLEWIDKPELESQIPMRFAAIFDKVHMIMREHGAPEIFTIKNASRMSNVLRMSSDSLTQILNSEFNRTRYQKLSAVLTFLTYFIHVTMSITDSTINTFNGELEAALRGTTFDEI